jgi:hypothetical protein
MFGINRWRRESKNHCDDGKRTRSETKKLHGYLPHYNHFHPSAKFAVQRKRRTIGREPDFDNDLPDSPELVRPTVYSHLVYFARLKGPRVSASIGWRGMTPPSPKLMADQKKAAHR